MKRLCTFAYPALLFSLLKGAGCVPVPQSGLTMADSLPGPAVQAPREQFDPRVLEEDLLLIQPVFAPAPAPEPSPTPAREAAPEPAPVPAETRPGRSTYRVQLMALSNPQVAHQRREALEQILGVPVQVVQRGSLFMVQAGDYPTSQEAEALKKRAATLSRDYADAYVVGPLAQEPSPPLPSVSVEEGTMVQEPALEPQEPALEPPVLVPAFGWRVLLDQFLAHEEAERLKRQATTRLGRSDIDVTFKAPWYKVEVGHYRTEAEAQEAVEQIGRLYQNSIKVRSQILVPQED
jgi:cell division protein FtsN